MKAMIYDKNAASGPVVLREVEKPVPGEGQVLVKVAAVSVNAMDYRSMQLGSIPKSKIFGAGMFQVGDAVFGDIAPSGFGGFAEYVAAPETLLAPIPTGVSFEDAASLPVAAITALQGLRDAGRIRPGQQVLIYGAGGGVGTFAVQLAKHFGAVVTAVCGPANVELVRSLGADRVVNYVEEDGLASGRKFDLILGVNGSQPLGRYRSALAANGIFVMAGGSYRQIFMMVTFGRLLSWGNRKMHMLVARSAPADLNFLIGLVADGKLKPVIERCYPLEETAEAVRYLRQGHARGKVVVQVAQA
jgi:NADPH:quinone reductase-like Zn-dependent oxidoreductase